MELAPVVLFVYNRPELTLSTLEHLSRNELAADSTLYIFCDGPKPGSSEAQLALIEQTRKIVRSRQWCKEVIIEEAAQNKGLANSIIYGVTKIVNQFGKIIVLEDDLVVAPHFLAYINEALVKYEHNDKMLAVHGYMYPIEIPADYPDETLTIHDPGCWGWGTWARAWSKFEPDSAKLIQQIKDRGLKAEFDFWGGYPFFRMLHQQQQGKVSSWAIRWRATAYLHDMLTLYPTKSLVRHDGNVPSATHHYTVHDYTYTELYPGVIPVKDIPVVNNLEIEKRFGVFLRKNAGMTIKEKVRDKLIKIWRKIAGNA
ncbi:hypothetical protein SAMN05444266_11285 [Chitinophaga jiangningensis]|uniref:Glycosyl transferase family 2 n=1 Tax=Chitinophaga jiangningensis TaxID=1419482 RepID=A0A1M7M637_9BACT|nr:hypothetical protein [Chitinophaga jiangningensis]SHM86086.1 hypothetical protein SAMN05444266_11285 [Chitinophaga jiangningensis]